MASRKNVDPQDLHRRLVGEKLHATTRRTFLGQMGSGIGGMALAWAAAQDGWAGGFGDSSASGAVGLDLSRPHFAPRAKRVIYLHMAGSPPHHDLLDPKPKLLDWNGKPCPDHLLDPENFAFIKGHPEVLASPYAFQPRGKSGTEISELLPELSRHADRIAVVRSMHTDQFNHAPAQLLLYTGSPRLGRPSIGSWISYGLGSENRDLPAYVVLVSGGKTPSAGKSVWGNGFLPSVHQGVQCRSDGDPVLFASNPPGIDRETRGATIEALAELNGLQCERNGDPETLARIAQYELAFRMQVAVPEVMDIAHESPETIERYGATPGAASFANNCLLARRMLENDVRFIQLFDWGWDTHGTNPSDDIINQLPKKCLETDRPIAALLDDLVERGLLEDTLVIWSGEFGRTAMNERRNGSVYFGRDHHPHCFSIWMAGGGVKPGIVHGETCDFGAEIVKDPVHVHDLQATVLRLLGFDHERLIRRHQGRDFRLTDVHGSVVPGLLA
ncbi:MAG: DUF1501 domain-containing protein [Planctomycetota bacterium]|nr:DUF1501 domain-containing protein [Planctomycetota bacterium]